MAKSKARPVSSPVSDVTRMLNSLGHGDPTAADELLPLVYQELRKLAALKMVGQAPGHTLQPTALVHEVYLRLVDLQGVGWRDRAHFLAVAARTMRRILVEQARHKRTLKAGGGLRRVEISGVDAVTEGRKLDLLAFWTRPSRSFRPRTPAKQSWSSSDSSQG